MRKILFAMLVMIVCNLHAQKNLYRASASLENKLVHTALSVHFDYDRAVLHGNVKLTMQPYFYSTDSVVLDAKEMNIEQVRLLTGKTPAALQYRYDGYRLIILLNKKYRAGENYSIAISYTTKAKNKGLYFINPGRKIKDKPVQIWTDGEPELTSYWCPTIDHPNQKGTLGIEMTVPDQYRTLSNGTKVSSRKNKDNTRTDTWNMDLPLSPYLFFMCVGDFAEIPDQYRNVPVNYYVEKKYENIAKQIFGQTPEMMGLYERLTGIAFPWPKYAQVVVRDFTSAAMENTSMTAHSEAAQQDLRELADGNRWENNIAHELFHQWFGDYVTCESWSNLSLNESFASYGTYLWREYKYGRDKADEGIYEDMQGYLGRKREHTRNLVRFNYDDPDDMFDDVSYQKGGCILHMLRRYVGDSAFFKSLHLYLENNKHKAAEVHQLRLAFEQVTGKDLNAFFNQWFYDSGHPIVEINYRHNDAEKKISVIIEQKQVKSFSFPITIDLYSNNSRSRHPVWVSGPLDTFSFPGTAETDFVNVDADKYMLWEKKDNKSLSSYIALYEKKGNYLDRLEAVQTCLTKPEDRSAVNLLLRALTDSFPGIRLTILQGLLKNWEKIEPAVKTRFESIIIQLAANDTAAVVRAKALELTGTYRNSANKSLFIASTNHTSYSVAGAALSSLVLIDSAEALSIARKQIGTEIKRSLLTAVLNVICNYGNQNEFEAVYTLYAAMPLTGYKLSVTNSFIHYLEKVEIDALVKNGIDQVLLVRNGLPAAYQESIDEGLKNIARRKQIEKRLQLSEYILSKLPK